MPVMALSGELGPLGQLPGNKPLALVERVSSYVTILFSLHSLNSWCLLGMARCQGSGIGGDAALPPTFGATHPPDHLVPF